MGNRVKFIFDLDGTLTQMETLPFIAEHFAVQAEIAELTQATVRGEIEFAESFTRRVEILGRLPVDEVRALLAGVPLHEGLMAFIRAHSDDCAIATGNLCEWTYALGARIGCELFGSTGVVEANRIVRVATILDKAELARTYQRAGYRVVFIGDGANDVAAMRAADVAIACGLTHAPASSVLAVADYAIYDEAELVGQLNSLLEK